MYNTDKKQTGTAKKHSKRVRRSKSIRKRVNIYRNNIPEHFKEHNKSGNVNYAYTNTGASVSGKISGNLSRLITGFRNFIKSRTLDS
jgi:hypothetical protein